jgi:hypothetical protein
MVEEGLVDDDDDDDGAKMLKRKNQGEKNTMICF